MLNYHLKWIKIYQYCHYKLPNFDNYVSFIIVSNIESDKQISINQRIE
jgi:hypothetical protein